MRRSAVTIGLFVIFMFSIAFAAETLTNDAIVTMVKGGVGEDLLIAKVRTSEGKYDLSPGGILSLKNAGVSEAIIKAMVEASAPPLVPQPRPAEAVAKDTQDAIALYRQGKGAEAAAAFDKLLVEKPGDDSLVIWRALALLEQAQATKDLDKLGYRPLVARAYTSVAPLKLRQSGNPDWNLAMAKAFWLNDRPTWASRAAGSAMALRSNFVEAQLVLGDIAYDTELSALNAPATDARRDTSRRFAGTFSRKEYEKALALPNISTSARAEALYKLGLVSAVLEGKRDSAREYWERAAAEDGCRYGRLAQDKLKMGAK